MIKVKISTSFPECLIRQTPGAKGIWKGIKFIINENIDECDYWIIYEGVSKIETTKCPKENIIFITGEPPSLKEYEENFYEQFSTIITCHRNIKHKNVVYSQQALPWHIASSNQNSIYSKTIDELEKPIPLQSKKKLISVITSSKEISQGHIDRKNFVFGLKNFFGDKLDIFGKGINEVEDKSEAIVPYKYHIVIENSSYNDYWTEKLSDCLLGEAYPFYFGCPNIGDYYPDKSLTRININDLNETIKIISSEIKQNKFEKSIPKIKEAKSLTLYKYNVFEVIFNIVKEKRNTLFERKCSNKIYPENFYKRKRYEDFVMKVDRLYLSNESDLLELFNDNPQLLKKYLKSLYLDGKYNDILKFEKYKVPYVNFYLGRVYKNIGNLDKSTEFLVNFLSSKDPFIENDYLISALFHSGENFYNNSDFEKSLKMFIKCNKLSNGKHQKAIEYLSNLQI